MKLRIFPGIVFVLLGGNVAIVATTIYFAVGDPAAAVEPDYYQKAVHWDDAKQRTAASARLGWSASVAPDPDAPARVLVSLTDSDGAPVQGAHLTAEIFHHARSGDRTTIAARPMDGGRYELDLPSARAGLWQFRLDAVRGEDRFVCTIDRALGAPAPRSSASEPSTERPR